MTTDVKAFLLARHPWYARMSGADNWPKVRAARGDLNDACVKEKYLIRGKFEKDEHFKTRIALSEFAGVTAGIIDRFTGAIFEQPVETAFGTDPGARGLEAWAKDIDGMGTSLLEFVRDQAPDIVGMGGVAVLVDMDPPTPEQEKLLSSVAPEARSMDLLKRAGIPWAPRLCTYQVEEVTNWDLDDAGRPEWVVLTRICSEQDLFADRVPVIEWLVIDRVDTRVYRAGFKDIGSRDVFSMPISELYQNAAIIDEPSAQKSVPHGCGCVPIAWLGDPQHPLRAKSLLMGTVRADISAFNESSQGEFARYLHNVPAAVLKSKRDVSQVIRDSSVAIVLNPEANESFEYASTPADGFDINMKSVENKKLDGFRQAGADPTGMFEQTSKPESGTAKKSRFSNTEARLLSKMAAWFQFGHWALLDMVVRRLAPTPLPIDQKAFQGSVRYPSKFDQDDVLNLLDQFGQSKEWLLDSETFLKTMLTRIALTIMGDVSEEKKKAVSDDVAKLTPKQLQDRLVVVSPAIQAQGFGPPLIP